MGSSSSVPALTAMAKPMDMVKFTAEKWYVISNIPTPFEKNAYNAEELYTYDESQSAPIGVTFTYNKGAFDGKKVEMQQKGWIYNHETMAEWRVSPKIGPIYAPFKLPYIVLDIADDYSHTVVGYPDRSYLWIMARKPKLSEETYDKLVERCKNEWGYDVSKIQEVPQQARD